jgi:hypothetical protein
VTDDDTPVPNRSNASRRLVNCARCGRSDECSASDLLRFTREGWPKCCGQVMALFTSVPNPGSGDTGTDLPSVS